MRPFPRGGGRIPCQPPSRCLLRRGKFPRQSPPEARLGQEITEAWIRQFLRVRKGYPEWMSRINLTPREFYIALELDVPVPACDILRLDPETFREWARCRGERLPQLVTERFLDEVWSEMPVEWTEAGGEALPLETSRP